MASKMIYPIDVEKQASEASRLVGVEKTKLIALLILIVNGLIMLFTVPFFTSIGVPGWIPVLVQLTLMTAIGVFLLRVFVIKEDEKLQEYKGSLVDSFAKYYSLRNLDSADRHNIRNTPIRVYEYSNGSAMFVLALKFGSNDTHKARNTRQVIKDIFNHLGKANLIAKEYIMTEDFSRSVEYRTHIEKLSRTKNLKLAKAVMEINQAALDTCAAESNTDVRYIIVQTKSSYQKYDLPFAIEAIIRLLDEKVTSFRSVEFLDKTDFVEFMRVHYGLGAVDLSLMKASMPEEDLSEFNNLVSVYQLIGKDKFGSEKKLTDYTNLTKSVRNIKRIK